jgi:hypothetical protein
MTTATDMLAAYILAETAILQGKEATIGDRKLRFEDLAEIRKGRQEWEAKVSSESASAAKSPSIGGLRFSTFRLDQ